MPKRFWLIYSRVNNGALAEFPSYQEAEDEAKRRSATGVGSGQEYFILETVSYTKRPVPEIDVVKFA